MCKEGSFVHSLCKEGSCVHSLFVYHFLYKVVLLILGAGIILTVLDDRGFFRDSKYVKEGWEIGYWGSWTVLTVIALILFCFEVSRTPEVLLLIQRPWVIYARCICSCDIHPEIQSLADELNRCVEQKVESQDRPNYKVEDDPESDRVLPVANLKREQVCLLLRRSPAIVLRFCFWSSDLKEACRNLIDNLSDLLEKEKKQQTSGDQGSQPLVTTEV